MPNAFNGGEAYPVRTWLTSWNRAIQIHLAKLMSWAWPMKPCSVRSLWVVLDWSFASLNKGAFMPCIGSSA